MPIWYTVRKVISDKQRINGQHSAKQADELWRKNFQRYRVITL